MATTVLNFGHPLSDDAQRQLAEVVGEFESTQVRVHLDMIHPLARQVSAIVAGIPLSPEQWATVPLVVVLPGSSVAAALVLTEIHGRCGYFPRIATLVSGEDRVFRLGEILDLAAVRNAARQTR